MHRACGVGLAIQFAPLFTAWALWGKAERTAAWRGSRWAGSSSCCWCLALLTGVWNVRTGSDVGLWQRGHAFLGLAWLAIAAFCLDRHWRARDLVPPLPSPAEAEAAPEPDYAPAAS